MEEQLKYHKIQASSLHLKKIKPTYMKQIQAKQEKLQHLKQIAKINRAK